MNVGCEAEERVEGHLECQSNSEGTLDQWEPGSHGRIWSMTALPALDIEALTSHWQLD